MSSHKEGTTTPPVTVIEHHGNTTPHHHHRDSDEEADKEVEQFFPNPYPALPVFNNPVYTKEFEDSVKSEHSLPLDTWHTLSSVRRPPATQLGEVYSSRREAWEKSGWVHCRDFLGQGGFGKVYLGFQYEDRHSNTPLISRKLCAIKEVVIKRGDIGAMDDGIAAEAYVLRACAHPNIVRLFKSYCIPSRKRFYFVMEFADGKDLQFEIIAGGYPANEGPLWEEYGRSLFIGIVEGIAYLHGRGVAHRDIKPENVLIRISADGQRKIPKIADFGLSVIYVGKKQKDGTREQFIEHGACGTRNFMAPELHYIKNNFGNFNHFQRDRPIPRSMVDMQNNLEDERMANKGANRRPICEFTDEYRKRFYRPTQTDVYALGVTLYVMLTGEQPYDHHNAMAMVHLFRCEPMRNHWHLTPEAFDFICQMLEPNPSKRLTIQQVQTHEWMKGPTTGPEGAVKRHLPAPYHSVYVSPTPSPGPSTGRPDDKEAGHQLDPVPPPYRGITFSSEYQDAQSGPKGLPSYHSPDAGGPPAYRSRSVSGRGQAPEKMGALINAFNSMAMARGPVGRQRSMSLGAGPGATAAPLRARSASLNSPPSGPSRVRPPSPPPAIHHHSSHGPESPQRQTSAEPKKQIMSTLKEMASRVAAGVTGATAAHAPHTPHKSGSPPTPAPPPPSIASSKSKEEPKEPIMTSTTVKSTTVPSVPHSSRGSSASDASSGTDSSGGSSSDSAPGRSGRGRKSKKGKGRRK